MLLYDGKTVVWYAVNAARIIGSITCGACLKGKMYCNNPHTEDDMKINVQDVASFVSRAEIWTEMNNVFVWCAACLCGKVIKKGTDAGMMS